MVITEQYKIIRIKNNIRMEVDDIVVIESHLGILIDGKPIATLQCSPDSQKALVYGYLVSQRLISSKDHVTDFFFDKEKNQVLVSLAKSACHKEMIGSNTTYSLTDVQEVAGKFIPGSDNFRATGALHSAALCRRNQILIYKEDLSRHCAFDKMVGEALLSEISMKDCYAITSGRVPNDMFDKVLAAGIPAIFSRSAPTQATVNLARKTNTILCGFVREGRMNIYSEWDRIKK
jgi:FdhD protein